MAICNSAIETMNARPLTTNEARVKGINDLGAKMVFKASSLMSMASIYHKIRGSALTISGLPGSSFRKMCINLHQLLEPTILSALLATIGNTYSLLPICYSVANSTPGNTWQQIADPRFYQVGVPSLELATQGNRWQQVSGQWQQHSHPPIKG
jgi:hypothetical protein